MSHPYFETSFGYYIIEFLILYHFISAQLWRLTSKGHLENKLRDWNYIEPNLTEIDPDEGVIEVQNIGKVLTMNNKTKVVEYEVKKTPVPTSQKWTLGSPDGHRWQTIQHADTGLYLTARYKVPIPILTVESEIGNDI